MPYRARFSQQYGITHGPTQVGTTGPDLILPNLKQVVICHFDFPEEHWGTLLAVCRRETASLLGKKQ